MLILSCTFRSLGCDLRVCFERVSMAMAVLASEMDASTRSAGQID